MTDKQIDHAKGALRRMYDKASLAVEYGSAAEGSLNGDYQRVMAALEKQRAPEGWKLVPLYPSKAMYEALFKAQHLYGLDSAAAYGAMLAASPEPNDD